MKSTLTHFLVTLGVCVIVFVAYGVWYSTISGKSTDVASLEIQITDATANATRTAAARAALAEIADDEATVQHYFIPEGGVVAFIDDLESRGRSQGINVNVTSVSTGGTVTQPTLILALTAKGSFDAVMRTIGIIEYSPYDILVTALSLGQEGKDTWHADMQVVVGSVSAATMTPVVPQGNQKTQAIISNSHVYF